MGVKYDKLWAIVEARGMTWEDLRVKAGLTVNAVTRLRYNENTQVETLAKVCCALDCTMDDIVEVEYPPSSLVPVDEIDLYELKSYRQYSNLGISSLDDFPPPHTARSIRDTLMEYFTSSKLSLDACAELIEALRDKGTEITFPKDIAPDIKYIPKTFSQFENESEEAQDVINQQIANYLSWAMLTTEETWENKLAEFSGDAEQSLVEYGHMNARLYGGARSTKFVGQHIETKDTKDCYPINLLSAIFGESSTYSFTILMPDLAQAIDRVLQRFTLSERLWVKARYQHGLTGAQIVQLLGLPSYETLISAAGRNNKILRKMRHPATAKLLHNYRQVNPYDRSRTATTQYDRFFTEIKDSVSESLRQGQTLEQALAPYYQTDTIQQIVLKANMWKSLPQVSIDTLELSWKAHAALSHAQIHTLSELWDAHGKSVAISDAINSGLSNIPGLGQTQILELLSKLSEYEPQQIDSNKAFDIVTYAENLLIGNNEDPSIACNIMPHAVLDCFLRMKYRMLDDLLTDYTEGNLEQRIRNEFPEVSDQAISVLDMLVANQYSMVHFVGGTFWKDLLEKNPGCTLETVRSAYLKDLPIKCNPQTLQDHIFALFPVECAEFDLMYKTRSQGINWLPWPLPLFTDGVKKRISINSESVTSAFFAADEKAVNCWIVIKNKTNQVAFFEFNKGELSQITMSDPSVCESIFQAIEFSSEIFMNTPHWKSYINENYCAAQRDFCKFYGSHTAIAEDQEFFNAYVPQKIESKATIQMRHQITIDELDLTVRSFNVLKRANINTLSDLMAIDSEEFLKLRNLGKKSAVEIIEKALSYGVKLSDSLMDLYRDYKHSAT